MSNFRSNVYLNISLSLSSYGSLYFAVLEQYGLQNYKLGKCCVWPLSHIYWLIESIEILRICIVKISFGLFSQGSCSLYILSYAAEHPNFLEHYHTRIHGFKTPHDFKKFWTFPSLSIRNNFLKKFTWKNSWSDMAHTAEISHSEGLLLCYAAWEAEASPLHSCARSLLCRYCGVQCRQWQSLVWDISRSVLCTRQSVSVLHWFHSESTLSLEKYCAEISLKGLIPGYTEMDQSQPG